MSLILSGTDGLSDVDGTAATPAIRGTDANTGIFFPAADTIAFSEGGAEAMRIDSAGNVGIGTTSPVNSGAGITTLTVNGTTQSGEVFQVAGVSTGFIYSNASDSGLGTLTATLYKFFTNSVERMRIDSSGNVGIGNTTPSSFDATGKPLVVGSGSGNQGITIYAGTTGYSTVNFADGTTGTDRYAGQVSYDHTNNALLFATTTGLERARIDSSGNLLVGGTSANGRVSSVAKSGFSPAGSAGTWASSPAISVAGAFGGGVSWIDGGGGYCAWVDTSGANFNIAGALTSNSVANGVFLNGYSATVWSARSDERLKDKFEPITDAINKVVSLRAVTGVYKNFPNDRQVFLFAQDVQKVLPEAVCIADKESPEQYLGLAYTQVIPLLVAAIKEQQALIQSLTTRITALETK